MRQFFSSKAFLTPSCMSKQVSLCFLAMILLTGLRAQLLSTNPNFPKDNSSLSIIVDCTKGNQGLLNYPNTNDVYVHIGVITNLSANAGDWKYSRFAWGTTMILQGPPILEITNTSTISTISALSLVCQQLKPFCA